MTAYNGAEERFPTSIARLEDLFKTTVVTAVDPSKKVDIVVVQGTRTPALAAPVSP